MKTLLLLLVLCLNLYSCSTTFRRILCPPDGYDFYFSYEQYDKYGKVYFFKAQRFGGTEELIFPFTDFDEIKGGHLTNTPPDMIIVGHGFPIKGEVDRSKVQWPMRPEGSHKISSIQENTNLTK